MHHPDVNPDNPQSAERFKRITSAYTSALLQTSRRAKLDADAKATAAAASGIRNAAYGREFGRGASWRREGAPRAAPGASVDGRRFNVREWEFHHYGMHGGTEQEHDLFRNERMRAAQQTAYVRNMARQQRARAQMAAAYRQARAERGPRTGMGLFLSVAACGAIWAGVFSSANARFR